MAFATSLPDGYWHRGRRYRRAELRPLSGADEAFLLELGEALPAAHRTTAVLTRCLVRLGPLERVQAPAVRGLTVGDREALLLELRRATLGERMDCVVSCPECDETLDVELRVGDLLVSGDSGPQPWYEEEVASDGVSCCVRFRLPRGGDQEAVARLARADPAAAAQRLLRRCVERVTNGDGESLPPERWPEEVERRVPARIAELDPQAELTLATTCPACGRAFAALFDAGAFLLEEVSGRASGLFREVHALALHYHWSESEILSLTPAKRRLYLGLLQESVAGGEAW